MANFPNAAGVIGNSFASTAGSLQVDPALGFKTAVAQRQRDEEMFAQYGLFSPIGVLKNVMGYGDNKEADAKINKWRKWGVNNIESMPIGTAYALFGNMYPYLLQHVQATNANRTRLLAGIGGEKGETMQAFYNNYNKEYQNAKKVIDADNTKGFRTIIRRASSARAGDKEFSTLDNAYWVALDAYNEKIKDKKSTQDDINQSYGLVKTIRQALQDKVYNSYLRSKDPAEYAQELKVLAGMQNVEDNINSSLQQGPFGIGQKTAYNSKDNISLLRSLNMAKKKRNELLKTKSEYISKGKRLNALRTIGQFGLGGALQNFSNVLEPVGNYLAQKAGGLGDYIQQSNIYPQAAPTQTPEVNKTNPKQNPDNRYLGPEAYVLRGK